MNVIIETSGGEFKDRRYFVDCAHNDIMQARRTFKFDFMMDLQPNDQLRFVNDFSHSIIASPTNRLELLGMVLDDVI